MDLLEEWAVQSSRKVTADGEAISSQRFKPANWYRTTVPATVVAVQVRSGELPDPYVGMNLRRFPGMTYPIGLNSFNNVAMDPSSPYACSWWYRTQFNLPRRYSGRTIWLHFRGINYRANIWINGRKLADAQDVAGAYRIYEFNATSLLAPGDTNVLAVEVFAATDKELGINWVDWNPTPPDKNLGLWGDVYLTTSGPVSVRYSQVTTHFPGSPLEQAELKITAQLQNATNTNVNGILEAEIDGIRIQQQIELLARETRPVAFDPGRFTQLLWKKPDLWWPAEIGPPKLHNLSVRFIIDHLTSDEEHIRFGIREVTSELTEQGHRLFRINGKKILIRGGGWTQDMLLRPSRERLRYQMEYVRDLNLNTIRLEGQLEREEFFDLADEMGILVMAGWCCCDIWERWDEWPAGTLQVAKESLRKQALRLRGHPSVFVWLNGSDGPPPADVERAYLDVLREAGWSNPIVSSASSQSTSVSGSSGMKMTGPYDYEPPSYWLQDKGTYGGAWGFNTETSPGPAVPPIESLRRFLSPEQLWPINEVWNYHSAGERFQTMDRYHEAMNAVYGKPSGLEDYLRKSQAMSYEGQRAMFEAYAQKKYTSTGVIQWMLNNAWPSTYWHLFDYYLHPAGGYFGTKKACEPLHIQYSYDENAVVVVNSHRLAFSGLKATAQLFDFGLKEIFAQESQVAVDADSSSRVFLIPAFPSETATVHFLKLSLSDAAGKEISSNFYWLPTKLSELAWNQTPDTAFTPVASFEDMTELNRLPPVEIQVTAQTGQQKKGEVIYVKLRNATGYLAFQVHLGIRDRETGEEILPVLWQDNYVSLMPGESKNLAVRLLHQPAAMRRALEVIVDGWNVQKKAAPLFHSQHQIAAAE
jgi:exo-1,4-beta-D-glucosaminidase